MARPDHAAERRHRAAGEHHGADQRAAGDHAVVDQVHAPDQHDQRDQLLRDVGKLLVQPMPARLQAGLGGGGGRVLVAVQEAALRADGLDVFQAFDRLDDDALQVGLVRRLALIARRRRRWMPSDIAISSRHAPAQHPAERAADDEGHHTNSRMNGRSLMRRQRGAGEESRTISTCARWWA